MSLIDGLAKSLSDLGKSSDPLADIQKGLSNLKDNVVNINVNDTTKALANEGVKAAAGALSKAAAVPGEKKDPLTGKLIPFNEDVTRKITTGLLVVAGVLLVVYVAKRS